MSQVPPGISQTGIQIVPLIAPGMVAGENCTVDPTALPEGQFPLLQNLRLYQRVPTVRAGDREIVTTSPTGIASSGAYRGSWSGLLNGSYYVFAAYLMATGEVAAFSLNMTTYAWTEITTSSTTGPFGDTRIASDSGMCYFCKVPTIWQGTTRDLLLFSNGSAGYPRVYDTTAASGFKVSKLDSLNSSVPGKQTDFYWQQTFPVFWPVAQYGYWSVTSSGSGFTPSVPESGGVGQGLQCVVASPTASSSFGFGVSGNWGLPNCLQLIIRASEGVGVAGMLTTLKWQLYDTYDSTWHTIYDPAGTTAPLTVVSDTSTGCSGVVYYAANLTATSVNGLSESVLASATQFRFVATTALSYSGTLIIGLVAGGGNVPGLAAWGVAYRNAYSGAESNGYVLTTGTNLPATMPVTSLGGVSLVNEVETDFTLTTTYNAKVGAVYEDSTNSHLFIVIATITGGTVLRTLAQGGVPGASGYLTYVSGTTGGASTINYSSNATSLPYPIETIPNSELLNYSYTLTAENPNDGATISGDLGSNPTHADFYINYAGSNDYTYYASTQLYAQSGTSWTGQVGTSATFSSTFGATTVTTEDDTVPLPDGSHGYIPRPVCAYKSAQRLFMGGDYGTYDLYFSEEGFPFRFRPTARYVSGSIDPLSSSRDTFNAPVMGMAPMGDVVNGIEIGVPVMIVWTTQMCYRVFGADCTSLSAPVPLGPHGLATTNGWAQHYTNIFWLDQERQVMALGATAMVGYMSEGTAGFMGGAMQPMSRGTVESRLMNGVVTYASAAYWNHRLYVTYRQSSDTASIRVLVYDEHPAEQAPGTWTEDLLPAAAEGWNVYDNGTLSPILLYFDNAGHVYLHEDPTETGDLGSAIPVEITSRVITLGPQQGLWVRQVGIICDDCGSGVSANLTLTYQRTGLAAYWNAANSNALSLYGSGNPQVWRRTADAPAFAGSTYYDYGAQLDLRASLPPGTRILSLYAAVETRANGEDQL